MAQQPYQISGYTTDEELIVAFADFVQESDTLQSDSQAVIYCIRQELQRSEKVDYDA